MSGRKNALAKYNIVNSGDMSLSSVTSDVVNIEFLDNIGIQIVVSSGSPTGVFSVDVSSNWDPRTGAGRWVTITTAAVTGGSPTDTYFDLNQLSAPWIRLVYTKTSGSGSFNATIVGKMI